MQIISTIALYNYKVPVIVKKNNFTFCPGKSRQNSTNIFQDFPGLTNKIQGLSRTFQDTKKNPGLSRTFPGCGNPDVFKLTEFASSKKLFLNYKTSLAVCPVFCPNFSPEVLLIQGSKLIQVGAYES